MVRTLNTVTIYTCSDVECVSDWEKIATVSVRSELRKKLESREKILQEPKIFPLKRTQELCLHCGWWFMLLELSSDNQRLFDVRKHSTFIRVQLIFLILYKSIDLFVIAVMTRM